MILKIYRSVAMRFVAFKDRHEMNEHMSLHIHAAGKKLHKNARSILNMITQHSVKYGGVSWLSDATMAKMLQIHQDTVKRALKRLQVLHIGHVEVVEVSGLTLRYFVLNRFEFAEDLKSDLLSHDIETSPIESSAEPSFYESETRESVEPKEKDIKTIRNNVVDDNQPLDASFTPSNVPTAFVDVVQRFFNSAQYIHTIWSKARLAHSKIGLSSPIEHQIDNVIIAFKESIFAMKNNRIKGDFDGYFYGTISALFASDRRREVNYVPSWAI